LCETHAIVGGVAGKSRKMEDADETVHEFDFIDARFAGGNG